MVEVAEAEEDLGISRLPLGGGLERRKRLPCPVQAAEDGAVQRMQLAVAAVLS